MIEQADIGLPERTQERIRNDQVKFAELAKSYKTELGMYTSELLLRRSNTDYKGPSIGQRRRRSKQDDSSSSKEDNDKPDDHGPRRKWTVDSLSAIDRRTVDQFPPPPKRQRHQRDQ